MRSKKALALLLAASMVFTMNTSIFAGVKAASDDDGKVITQSDPDIPDTDSENKKDDDDPSGPDTPSGPDIPDRPDTPSKTVSAGDLPDPDDKGTTTIDADDTHAAIGADALEKLVGNENVKKVEIKLTDSAVTLPKAALKSILEQLEANGAKDFTISAFTNDISGSDEDYEGIKSATQTYYISLYATSPNNPSDDDDEYYDEESVNVQDYNISGLGKFSEPVGISFAASEATKKLAEANVYRLNPTTTVKTKEDVSDGTVDFETKDISYASFAVGAEAEAKGWISANFVRNAYVEEDGILKSKTSVEFIDSSEIIADGDYEGLLIKTGNKANGFKITAPIAVAPGYKFVKWVRTTSKVADGKYYTVIDESAENATIAAGASATFEPVIDGGKWVYYDAVVTPLYTESTNVIKDVNGHTVEVTYDKTPAYTGKKLSGGNIVTAVVLDGQDVTDLTKFKVKGSKTVGSEVTVTIKSIKGLDKDTNKALKDKEVGTAKIRPIEVNEVTLFDSKNYAGEGQITVKLKGDTVKKVKAIVPNGRKFDKNKGGIWKAKKLSVKKGTYTYDSSTKYIKFDGSVLSGTVKVGIRSK